jgi:hypothetical protein
MIIGHEPDGVTFPPKIIVGVTVGVRGIIARLFP